MGRDPRRGGGARIPEALRDQLGDGRRLVIPVGSRREQLLLIVERHGSEWTERSDGACVFVPLIGAGRAGEQLIGARGIPARSCPAILRRP